MFKIIFISLGLLAFGMAAQAKTFDCELTKYSKENYNDPGVVESITINGSESISLTAVQKGESITIKPDFDKSFKNTKTVRFVDSDTNITDAESGETGIFVSKALMEGRPGLLSLSTNQANEGDSGGQYIWYTDGSYFCK